jgi:hypothetical protein
MTTTQKNTINVIGCGGVGLNIVNMLEPARNSEITGFAKYKLCYVDTSKSNMIRKKINPDDVFLFEDMDGSGKIRKENHTAIAANTKAILQKFKPTDFNIVVHSASGGSGSVLAPSVVSELLKAGKEVIVIVVASFGSVIEVENTTKTLQTYESISELREKNVNVVYMQNSVTENNELQINSQAMHMLSLLLGLLSGEHEQLDTADLKTWLNHNKVTGNPTCINNVLVGYGPELRPQYTEDHFVIENPISVATLATRDMNTRYSHTPSIKFEGYVPSQWSTGDASGLTTIKDEAIHFCVMEDKMESIYKHLANFLKELRAAEGSRVRRKSILGDANVTDDGMVL